MLSSTSSCLVLRLERHKLHIRRDANTFLFKFWGRKKEKKRKQKNNDRLCASCNFWLLEFSWVLPLLQAPPQPTCERSEKTDQIFMPEPHQSHYSSCLHQHVSGPLNKLSTSSQTLLPKAADEKWTKYVWSFPLVRRSGDAVKALLFFNPKLEGRSIWIGIICWYGVLHTPLIQKSISFFHMHTKWW